MQEFAESPKVRTSNIKKEIGNEIAQHAEHPDHTSKGISEIKHAAEPKPALQPIKKKDLTAADIIERLKTGHFEADRIGIKHEKWHTMEPQRYNSSNEPLHHFEQIYEKHSNLYTAVLVTRGFRDRRFESFSGKSIQDAQKRACIMFKHDDEIQKVRRKLAPSIGQIRDFFTLDKSQRDQLRALGYESAMVQSDICTSIHRGFRLLGCRHAFWDTPCETADE